MTIKQKIATGLASLALLLPSTNSTQACTGAREGAMGSTGVSLCDNPNAVYWNQGRLAFVKQPEISFVQKLGNTDDFRYDQVANFVTPISKNIGVGVQYINSETKNTNKFGPRTETWQWLKIGLGAKVNDEKDVISGVGISVTPKIMTDTTQYNHEYENGKKIENKKTAFDIDASAFVENYNILKKDDAFRMGILLRYWGDYEKSWLCGLRPEISYTLPNKLGDSTIALGYYNLGPKQNNDDASEREKMAEKSKGIRAGIEQKIGKKFALRAGYVDFGESEDITYGIGYQGKRFGLNLTSSKQKNSMIEASIKF